MKRTLSWQLSFLALATIIVAWSATSAALPGLQTCGGQGQPACTPIPQGGERPTKTPTRTPRRTTAPSVTPSPTATPSPTVLIPSSTNTPRPSPTSTPSATPSATPRFSIGWQPLIDWLRTPVPFFLFFPPSPTPLPSVNIVMDGAEITQAIQCLHNSGCADNSVPMYTGKATMVRAYVRIFAGPTSLSNISGAICLGDTGEAGCSEPLHPIGPITISKMEDAVNFWRRPGPAQRELKGTLNFVIPASWVSAAGPLKFTVYVNYNEENIDETVYDISNWEFISTKVIKSVPLNVAFVQLSKAFVPFGSVWDLVSYLKRAYPTGDIRVWSVPVFIAETYAFTDTSSPGCGTGWNLLLKHLKWWTKTYPQHYYAMVNAGPVGGGYGGCGHRPGREAAGKITPGTQEGGEIAAQEIGHNLGRQHAPGCGAGNPDPSSSGFLGEFGVDTLLRRGYVEADREFMGYCNAGNSWVSLYTYQSIFAPFYSYAPPTDTGVSFTIPQASPDGEFLIGAGVLSPTTVTIQDGFYRLSLEAETHDDHSAGPYTVELQDRSGTRLFARNFAPLELSNHEPGHSGSFFLVLPWIDGAESIVFKHEGVEIGRRRATANMPVVEFLPIESYSFEEAGLYVALAGLRCRWRRASVHAGIQPGWRDDLVHRQPAPFGNGINCRRLAFPGQRKRALPRVRHRWIQYWGCFIARVICHLWQTSACAHRCWNRIYFHY